MTHRNVKLFNFLHPLPLLFVIGLFLLFPTTGRCGDTTDWFSLSMNNCVGVSPQEINRILHLEIRSAVSDQSMSLRTTALRIICSSNTFLLNVTDHKTGKAFRRQVQLGGGASRGVERIMVIAATELMLSSWEQISVAEKKKKAAGDESSARNEKSQTEIPSSGESVGNKTDVISESRDAGFGVSALWRTYPETFVMLFGGELSGMLHLRKSFVLQMNLAVAGGSAHRNIGSASLFSASGLLGAGMQRRLFSSKLQGTALLGFRGGYGRVGGKTNNATTRSYKITGGVGGPLVRLSVASATRFAPGLSVEIGYTVFGIVGEVDDATDISMKGIWGSLMLDLWFYK